MVRSLRAKFSGSLGRTAEKSARARVRAAVKSRENRSARLVRENLSARKIRESRPARKVAVASRDEAKSVAVHRGAKFADIDLNEEVANDLPEREDFEIDEDTAVDVPGSHRLRRRSIARHIWLICCDIFLALCILAFAGAIYLTSQAKKTGQAVEVLGYQPFLIATGSMEPTYAINGFVLTHNDDFAKLKIGDVVAFHAEGLKGQPALHRIIAIVGDGAAAKLYVKGDNNPLPDGAPVTRDNYIGRAIFNTNLTATYIGLLRGPNGIVKAVVLPLILLLLLYFGARFLIDSAGDWRTKGIAICVVVMLISAGILVSYILYNFKQVDYTNTSLAKVAVDFAKSDASKKWTVNGQAVVGRIEIPALKLDYPIINYQAATSLDTTIAQFSGAGVNLPGNEVLVGHRAFGDLSAFNLFFTNIDQLKPGDEIYLTGLGRDRVKYVVSFAKIVAPDDNSVLQPPAGENAREVTLIATTYDLKNRFVVQAAADGQ